MATVTKDFKIKYGLIVEGTTATVNNFSILTKSQADQDYIIGLIGGSATSEATADTVVLRDANADFAANDITVNELSIKEIGRIYEDDDDLIISNIDESDVIIEAEDIRLNATDDVRLTAAGGDVVISAQNGHTRFVDGPVHIGFPVTAENEVATKEYVDQAETDAVSTANTYTDTALEDYTPTSSLDTTIDGYGYLKSADLSGYATESYVTGAIDDLNTDAIEEAAGATNQYFTTARARNSVSGVNGVNYDSNLGEISAHLGNGLELSNTGAIQIDELVVATQSDLTDAIDDHSDLTTGVHGVTGNVVGTSDTQTLSNKTIDGNLAFGTNGSGIVDVSGTLEVSADTDLTLAAGGDIVLEATGAAYIGSVSAGNTIATNSYVDNAVSGLDWKNAVHLLADSDVNMTGATSSLVIDGHSALDSADNNVYRILLTNQDVDSENGIYVYTDNGSTYTLVRADDADAFGELVGAAVFVMEGTSYGQTSWVQSNHYLSDFTSQSWVQFSGSGSVVAGTGITVDGLEVSIDRTTVDTWYDAAGTAASEAGAVQDNLDIHTNATSAHGVTGDIVGTSGSQTLTNKTLGSGTVLSASIDAANTYTIVNLEEPTGPQDAATKAYVDGEISSVSTAVDNLTTDDVAEGTSKYFTDTRAKDAVAAALGDGIEYANGTFDVQVGGGIEIGGGTGNEVVINRTTVDAWYDAAGTAQNIVNGLDTDDIEEGTTNLYFESGRAKTAAAELLTGASLTNITITGTGAGLTITAENGVADSTTNDLVEGSTNKYFTAQRAVDALEAVVPNFTEIDINSVATQVAATVEVATASTVTAYEFAHADYRSAKFLVKAATSTHTELSEILITLDSLNNVAITEYAEITSNGNLFNVTADVDGANVRVRVTTAHNATDVTVVGTLVA